MIVEKPKPLINQSTIDWLDRAFPAAPYRKGMLLEEIAYDAGQQSVIERLRHELRH